MKEYYVRVEQINWVYVDAENEEEARNLAYDRAFTECADELFTEIIDEEDIEDDE